MQIHAVPAFEDNYIWVIVEQATGKCVVVDPGDAQPVIDFITQHNLQLSAILITHHHHDHTGGLLTLSDFQPCPVYGPDNPQIKGITHSVQDDDSLTLDDLNLTFRVIACPGHTLDHIAFYTKPWLFCGDTIFSAGCGRMFEGKPAQFVDSLRRLAALPDDTELYCAHEYTAANLRFARAVEPHNKNIQAHQEWVEKRRQNNQITLPSTLALEAQINPFLRCHLSSVQQVAVHKAQTSLGDDIEVFACLRHWKDNF